MASSTEPTSGSEVDAPTAAPATVESAMEALDAYPSPPRPRCEPQRESPASGDAELDALAFAEGCWRWFYVDEGHSSCWRRRPGGWDIVMEAMDAIAQTHTTTTLRVRRVDGVVTLSGDWLSGPALVLDPSELGPTRAVFSSGDRRLTFELVDDGCGLDRIEGLRHSTEERWHPAPATEPQPSE